ncbi:hypothetical protein OG788_45415 [Streptomyces sp. NBC_00647]|uniref:hypothetical protein n=1 Tax=Streptomyces sp. NBC_00647 TaxID=2975796 RepID=UPI0032457C26
MDAATRAAPPDARSRTGALRTTVLAVRLSWGSWIPRPVLDRWSTTPLENLDMR